MKPLAHHLQRSILLGIGTVMTAVMALASTSVNAKSIDFEARLATPIVQAERAQTAFLKVALTGFEQASQNDRAPANVVIVIDKSGSMNGERIERAKEAAIMAVNTLSSNDIVGIVAFDNTVDVVVPATKVSDKVRIAKAIESIRVAGGTGLFAGVSKGAAEVRKFLDKTRVNRVILLSDGQANIGPSSPAELGQLGAMLARQGMSVTTIGLGADYNEDLMTQLAGYSDGNHAFVQNTNDLVRVFQREFGDVGAVVAQEVEITIRLKPGIRPLRILGREGEITDGVVRLRMNQLYSQQEKYVVLEVEVPARKAGMNMALADVGVSYLNMQSKSNESLSRAVSVSFSNSADAVASATDKKAMVSAVQQVANETSKEALRLRDAGKVQEAKKVLESNAQYLKDKSVSLGSSAAPTPALQRMEEESKAQAVQMETNDSAQWNLSRKAMKADQYKLEKQAKP
jgi:Ca-activated chloride channel homolog